MATGLYKVETLITDTAIKERMSFEAQRLEIRKAWEKDRKSTRDKKAHMANPTLNSKGRRKSKRR